MTDGAARITEVLKDDKNLPAGQHFPNCLLGLLKGCCEQPLAPS